MTDSKNSLPSSSISRTGKPSKADIKRLTSQHETLLMRVNGLHNTLNEKDILIKSQRNTIKLNEQRILNLEYNNSQLKHIIGILTSYITEELNEVLPPLPTIAEDDDNKRIDPIELIKNREFTPFRKQRKHQNKRNTSADVTSALNTFAAAHRNTTGSKQKTMMFDENLRVNMYEDFNGSELLKSVLDAQLCREEMKKVVKFLLGKTSKNVFLFKTRTILFETISLFLSLRNVAYQNSLDVFLPRVMEMIVDILEVQKVILYLYDAKGSSFYSKIVTAEDPSQIVIEKFIGHFRYVEEALVINKACDDPRFDLKYDRISGFISTNLACYPLKLGEEFLGFLECSNKAQDFTKEDMILLSQITKHIAIGLSGQIVKDKLSELGTNAGISGQIQQSKESLLIPILNQIITNCKILLNCERSTIFIYDKTTNELVSLIATDIQGTIRIPIHRGIASFVFTSGKLVNCENATSNSFFNNDVDKKTGFITREVLAIKISNIGVIECLNKNTMTAFTKSDENRLNAISEILASIFEAGDNFEGLLKNADINEICLQAVKEAIVQVNSEGLLIKANKFAAEMLKLTPEKMAGASVNQIFENSEELLLKFMQTVREGGSTTYKEQKIVVNRKIIKVTATFLLIRNNEAGNFYLIFLTPINLI
ncbi:hypothetical protein SteCoe_24408 [Stentor coeruleus]|uniref:GAF domain-containing protein n=1 Tax=Stentor coeruleus TaxID=5963 RepID=A0A1R2BHQ2_9CILI|nr:hypothetical protein SteCoe_24408 [Stentor coeruleus]